MTDKPIADRPNDIAKQAEIDEAFMAQALLLADSAAEHNEVPVGAVVVFNGELIASGFNRPIVDNDASAHAEINALREAGKVLGNYRLPECTLYVTLEPCTMCLGAMIHARISRLVFAANEPRAGAVESQLALLDQTFFNHSIEWQGGVLASESSHKLKQFFKRRRT
jgi:tRNA(adenine34) deaminase